MSPSHPFALPRPGRSAMPHNSQHPSILSLLSWQQSSISSFTRSPSSIVASAHPWKLRFVRKWSLIKKCSSEGIEFRRGKRWWSSKGNEFEVTLRIVPPCDSFFFVTFVVRPKRGQLMRHHFSWGLTLSDVFCLSKGSDGFLDDFPSSSLATLSSNDIRLLLCTYSNPQPSCHCCQSNLPFMA